MEERKKLRNEAKASRGGKVGRRRRRRRVTSSRVRAETPVSSRRAVDASDMHADTETPAKRRTTSLYSGCNHHHYHHHHRRHHHRHGHHLLPTPGASTPCHPPCPPSPSRHPPPRPVSSKLTSSRWRRWQRMVSGFFPPPGTYWSPRTIRRHEPADWFLFRLVRGLANPNTPIRHRIVARGWIPAECKFAEANVWHFRDIF